MGAPGRLAGILAGALAAPLLLSACGGDDSVADPPVSSAPTSSPTGTPHRESPEHFIRRWAAERAMQNTGRLEHTCHESADVKPCTRLH